MWSFSNVGFVCSSSLSHITFHRFHWGIMAELQEQALLRSQALLRHLRTWRCHQLSTRVPCHLLCILGEDCNLGVLHLQPVAMRCQCTGNRITGRRHQRGTFSINLCPLNLHLRWRHHHKVSSRERPCSRSHHQRYSGLCHPLGDRVLVLEQV